MKALSIRQPWAWAILYAGKRIENRDWSYVPRSMIGETFYIHAAKGCTREEYEDAFAFMSAMGKIHGIANAPRLPPLGHLVRGALVGRARLDSVIVAGSEAARRTDSLWYTGGMGLVLADVEPLPEPIPYKGALGFFDVEAAERRD